jgi:hypothetical protein
MPAGIDIATLLGPVATGATDAISDTLPIAIPVLVALAAVSIGLNVFRKFGVKR